MQMVMRMSTLRTNCSGLKLIGYEGLTDKASQLNHESKDEEMALIMEEKSFSCCWVN
jgi:hypothetical protein